MNAFNPNAHPRASWEEGKTLPAFTRNPHQYKLEMLDGPDATKIHVLKCRDKVLLVLTGTAPQENPLGTAQAIEEARAFEKHSQEALPFYV